MLAQGEPLEPPTRAHPRLLPPPWRRPEGSASSEARHRTPRPLAGVIRKIVEWKSCRSFFYWRLRRRLREDELVRAMKARDESLSAEEALKQLHEHLPSSALADDREAVELLTSPE